MLFTKEICVHKICYFIVIKVHSKFNLEVEMWYKYDNNKYSRKLFAITNI